MRNTFTIFQREFATYFNSPIGYIYIIVFLLINSSLFLTPFFMNPQADMRPMFNMLPFVLCVLIPLITMRLWAEDRKENTIEMLLTFPMAPYELVLGKYLASFVFFLLAIAGTVTIPIMLGFLGKPDWGTLLTSYLGAILLGSVFLALGTFLSSLVRDQIIAAVISLAACFGLVLIGTDFMAVSVDGWVTGLGTLLKKILGLTPHYEDFCRGILNLSDISYFIVWSALFLFLNGLFLEGRSRSNINFVFSVAVLICICIGAVFNFITADFSMVRYDCTKGKIHTVSDATKNILKKLQTPVNLTLYITPKEQMPTEMRNIEQDMVDKLHEMSLSSSGKLKYKVVHLEVNKLIKTVEMGMAKEKEKKEKDKETIENLLFDKGVKPFSIAIFRQSQHSTQLVYSSLGISYEARKEEIIPQVVPQNIHDMEYQIMSAVYHLSRARKPVVVLIAPKDEVPPHIAQLMQQMGRPVPPSQDPYKTIEMILQREEYEVKRVALSKQEPLPEEYDALLIVNPKDFDARQRWEIARALRSGKNVFMAVQDYTLNYEIDRGALSIQKNSENPNLNELLQLYGVSVDSDYLMDESNILLTISTNALEAAFGGGNQIKLPNHVLVLPKNMNQEVSITSRLSQVPYLWGTALNLDKEKMEKNKLTYSTLLTSSSRSWKVSGTSQLIGTDIELPAQYDWMRLFVLEPKHVFNVMAKTEGLDEQKLSEEIREAFFKRNLYIAQEAKVEVVSKGKVWMIEDTAKKEKSYVAKDREKVIVFHDKFQQEIVKFDQEFFKQGSFAIVQDDKVWKVTHGTKEYYISQKESKGEPAALYVYEKTPPPPFPLMAMIEGQFPEVFEGQTRPNWAKPARRGPMDPPDDNTQEPPAKSVTPKPGKLIIMGCSMIFRKEFIQNSVTLFMNCVETLALSGELIKIRSKRVTDRYIGVIENRLIWQIVNYLLVPFLFILLGILRITIRKVSRDQYTLQMIQEGA